MFEDVAVFAEEEGEEFFGVVGDDVELDAVGSHGGFVVDFDGVAFGREAEDFDSKENEVGAKDGQIAVRQIDEADDAEHQRQARCQDGVIAAEQNALDQSVKHG